MELIATRDPREMIVLIENDRCIADAIQTVTGTRIGRRSAKLVDMGKMAASFVQADTRLAYRVNVRHVDSSQGRGEEACRRVLRTPDQELLAWRRVTVALRPEELPGKPLRTVACVRCGEIVFDGKDVAGAEGPLCRACATAPYYTDWIPEGPCD